MSENFTLTSLPAIIAGLKNAEVISSKFVYNYFTPDERINESHSTFPEDGVTDSAYFESRIAKAPRYIRIDFNAPQPGNPPRDLPPLSKRIKAGEKIIYENSPFNLNFSSIEVADTLVDNRCYQISSASLIFSSSTPVAGDMLETGVNTSATTINPKSVIFNSLGNIQSAGFAYAKTDVRSEEKTQFLKDVRAFWTSISINNCFIDDVTRQVSTSQMSIFSDEFASVLDSTLAIQEKSRQSSTPLKILSDYYDYTIPTDRISVTKPGAFENIPNMEFSLIGYVVQKISQQVDGSLKIYDDLIFNTGTTYLLDEGVRYGGMYSYQVRAVYNVTTYVAAQDVTGRGAGIAKVDMLFATAGSNIDVDCVEVAPPKPPEDLYFKSEADGSLFVGWRFPLNPQRDIKKFQVFRRKTVYEPFELLCELDFDDSFSKASSKENVPDWKVAIKRYPTTFYVDRGFNLRSKYIYAIASVDAHGLSSNYSSQFEVSLDLYTERLIVKSISRPGAPKPYPNLLLTSDFFPDLIKDSGHSKMTVYFDPSYTDLLDNKGDSLGHISFNDKKPAYKIHILETNLAQEQMIDIKMTNNKIVQKIPASEGKIYTQVI